MIYAPQSPRSRGFTLVELLVVIAIIATLVGITVPAVQGARKRAQVVQAVNDISQLSNAIAGFKTTYAIDYMPDTVTKADMGKIWPRFNALGVTPFTYPTGVPPFTANIASIASGNQAMVYYLAGGDEGGTPTATGFATSAQTPYNKQATSRQAAFFDFPVKRIDATNQFLDPWGTPYAYFTAINQQYNLLTNPTATVTPMKDSRSLWLNAHSFQIISAGPNKVFGKAVLPTAPIPSPLPANFYIWTPKSGEFAPNGNGADDLSNFAPGILGSDQ